jgi:repressor LexA
MIGKNIRYLRQTHGYSQAKLAQKLNIKQASISLWENGLTIPETKYLIEMTKIFNCPMDFFLSEEQHRPLDSVAIKRAAVPVIGQIACGEPITAEQNIDGYADLPDGVRADFALRCKGDSMAPTFIDGDLVLIRQQPDVENGQIAAISINGEATLKHVYHQQGSLLLVADNPSFAPLTVSPGMDDNLLIHGLAVGYTRIF